jgi:glutaredoxin
VEIVLVTRQGCHLCDEALAALRSLGVEPELRDVDADEQLHDQYDFRVPVVLADGRVVGEGKVRRDDLRRALHLPT